MILTAGYCASRTVAARRWRRPTEFDVDVMHAVMGVAMAGMLVPRLNPLRSGSWQVVFAAAMGWFCWQIIGAYRGRPANAHPSPDGRRPADAHSSSGLHRTAHYAPHLLGCGAMLYMYLVAGVARAGTAAPGMPASGMSASTIHSPGLAFPLAVALFGYVIWTTDRLTALPRVAVLARPPLNGPPLTGRALGAAALTSKKPVSWALAGKALTGGLRAGRAPGGAGLTGRAPTDSAVAREAGGRSGVRPPMSPRLAACCEIAMGVTMGYMLIQLL
jgi:hypothetical protein